MGLATNRRERDFRRDMIPVFLAALFSPLLFALYTNHIWEDFFITFRHSQNLCEGHGLVYYPGECVHGFTSPLGTLLPALCYLATGSRSYLEAIWAFRVLSALAFAGGGLLLWHRVRLEAPERRLPQTALVLLYVLEVKAVSFSANGMETAFMLLFLAWQVHLLGRQDRRKFLELGLCWAGLMWTRPDGCVYIAALAIADFLFGVGSRSDRLKSLLAAAIVCTLLYLPWFTWAWWYYGSPIPQTVLAKSNLASWARADFNPISRYIAGVTKIFLPIYYEMGDGQGWYPGIVGWCTGLGIFCASYWLIPVRDTLGRTCSLAFALIGLYLTLLNYMFPWYAPPALMLGLVVLARGVPTLIERVLGPGRGATIVATVLLMTLAAERTLMYAGTSYQMKMQMAEVEMGNRAKVGLWLKKKMRPGDTVYLEPVGYIGYFSGAKIRDWPGLVAPQVSKLAREQGRDFYTVIPALRPDWIVLRPWESRQIAERVPMFLHNYEALSKFDVTNRVMAIAHLPGRMYLANDACFLIFRKKATSYTGDMTTTSNRP